MTDDATAADSNSGNISINKLKVLRRNTKGHLTRTLRILSGLLNDVQIITDYVRNAESQFKRVEERHSDLMEHIEDGKDFNTEEDWMSECETEYIQVVRNDKRFIIHLQSKKTPHTVNQLNEQPPSSSRETSPSQSTVHHAPSSNNSMTGSSARPPASTPKMACMKFPTFSGDIKDYQRFKEMFNHCTNGMLEIEIFHQLTESMVRTTEKDKIKGCINVARAWQVLDECYGDKDKLVDGLLKDLENLKTYERKGRPNISSMTEFVQTLQNFETHTESVGLDGELNSKIMLNQIKQKLPEDHRIAYYKGVRDELVEDSLTGLIKWLHAELTLLKKAKLTNPDTPPSEQDSRKTFKSTNAATVHNNKSQ